MFCTLFCTKLDEDTFLWIKCVVQNVFFYPVLEKTRWRYGYLSQMHGFAHICFAKKFHENIFLLIKFVACELCANQMCVLCFSQSLMKISIFESNVRFKMFCSLSCTKFDEDTLLWINVWFNCFVFSYTQSSMKICFFESNVWFKMFCFLFCIKLDWDALLWISSVCFKCFELCFTQSLIKMCFFESNVWFKMFCAPFCPKVDEDTLLWAICVVQNVLCSVFEQSSMKIRFFESNVCFKMFFTKLHEYTFLIIKCMVQNVLRCLT